MPYALRMHVRKGMQLLLFRSENAVTNTEMGKKSNRQSRNEQDLLCAELNTYYTD